MKQNNQTKKERTIEVGKFYYLHDGSKAGHPCYVIWKNDERNRYLVVRFDSDKYNEIPKHSKGIKHITKLCFPIESCIKNSYIHNRPMLCKRKDIGKEMYGLTISSIDYPTINKVAKMPSERSPSFRK